MFRFGEVTLSRNSLRWKESRILSVGYQMLMLVPGTPRPHCKNSRQFWKFHNEIVFRGQVNLGAVGELYGRRISRRRALYIDRRPSEDIVFLCNFYVRNVCALPPVWKE